MIERRTALVLGAGASMPYGFPSGAELRQAIISGLENFPNVAGSYRQLVNVLPRADFPSEHIVEFRRELMNANTTSVDLFLERRPQFVEIGKVAIASVLLPAEANSRKTMFEPWVCKDDARLRASQGWYQYFASEMRLNYANWGRGLLTIITYNYDRSFDHYLFTILRSSCDKPETECWKQFKEIPIIHLHGQLGMLDPTLSTSVQYGPSLGASVAIQAAKEIKIIHEVKPTEEQFSRAQDALDEAEVVCFLGFGYARENMQRLEWTRGNRKKKLLGTVYHWTKSEQRRLGIGRYFNITNAIPSDWDILQFLRETDVLG